MKETTEAITWSTEGKPGDFSPKKEKNNYKEKNVFFLLSACRYYQTD